MKRIHGRKNQPLEYIEFTAINPNGRKMRFFTQKSGDRWNTYEADAGRRAGVRLHSKFFDNRSEAENAVKEYAEAFETGQPLVIAFA